MGRGEKKERRKEKRERRMDKKNTMLLTVIAVATLLVAVVGATFAYFSVSNTNQYTTTGITTTTDKIGAITIARGTEDLQMTLTATDMSTGNEKKYYSTVSGGKNHEDSLTKYDLAKFTLTGSEEKTKYTCTGNVKVKLEAQTKLGSAEESPTLPSFVTEDGKLHLEGPTNIDGLGGTTTDITLKDLKEAASQEKTISDVKFNLSGTTTEATLKGYLEVTNTSEEQNYMADKSFKVSIDLDGFKCTIDDDANE